MPPIIDISGIDQRLPTLQFVPLLVETTIIMAQTMARTKEQFTPFLVEHIAARPASTISVR